MYQYFDERKPNELRTIRCSHPVIIYNPYVEPLLLKCKCYIIKGRKYFIDDSWYTEFRYSLISAKYNRIQNIEDVESCHIVDCITGEMYPLYYIVPCGKCSLCLDKKQMDWQARAVCECNTSTSIPFFITLTYNNENLPEDKSVDKKEVQDFLKRFRSQLDYKGIEHSIRYVACGEYGAKYGRPHYHLILWNCPTSKTYEMLELVENSWTLGFSYVKPCDSGCISYVMKYVKKSRSAPYGRTPVFFLASRKNSIGKQWLEENKDWLLNNASLYFEVVDPFNNQIKKFGLPQYFIRKLYPTLSVIIPKEVRDAYRRACTIVSSFNKRCDWFIPDPRFLYIQQKYSFLPAYTADDLAHAQKHYTRENLDSYVNNLLTQLEHDITTLVLYKLPDDIKYKLDLRLARKDIVDKYVENNPYTLENLFADEYKISRHLIESDRRELTSDVPF